eukprot:7786922-Lingulodinium_polyedra.AAC.1
MDTLSTRQRSGANATLPPCQYSWTLAWSSLKGFFEDNPFFWHQRRRRRMLAMTCPLVRPSSLLPAASATCWPKVGSNRRARLCAITTGASTRASPELCSHIGPVPPAQPTQATKDWARSLQGCPASITSHRSSGAKGAVRAGGSPANCPGKPLLASDLV